MAVNARWTSDAAHAADDGFTMIEVIVAMMLTVIVMTGTANLFIRSLAATRLMQQRQTAAAVAQQMMEAVRAEDPKLAAFVATRPHVEKSMGGTPYRVATAVAECWVSAGSCGPSVAGAPRMYRVVVTVTWTPGAGAAQCDGGCRYTVKTLRDPSDAVMTGLREYVPKP